MSVQKGKKSVLSVSIDSELYAIIAAHSKRTGKSVSSIIEEALFNYLSSEERGKRKLVEAIREFEGCAEANERCFLMVRALRMILRALNEGGNMCDVAARIYTNLVDAGIC